MTASARLLNSVEPEQRERFSELAAAQGVSSSGLLARLVHRALIENPEEKVRRLLEEAAAGKAPAEKYTVRLMGPSDAGKTLLRLWSWVRVPAVPPFPYFQRHPKTSGAVYKANKTPIKIAIYGRKDRRETFGIFR
jgi:hypothetical protein